VVCILQLAKCSNQNFYATAGVDDYRITHTARTRLSAAHHKLYTIRSYISQYIRANRVQTSSHFLYIKFTMNLSVDEDATWCYAIPTVFFFIKYYDRLKTHDDNNILTLRVLAAIYSFTRIIASALQNISYDDGQYYK